MKKFLLIMSVFALILVLGACNLDSDFNGTWVKAKGESIACRDSFTFSGSNAFTVHDSYVQGGQTYTGTYKHLQGDQYQFNYGIGYNAFKIDRNGNMMDITLLGSDGVCKYNKEK